MNHKQQVPVIEPLLPCSTPPSAPLGSVYSGPEGKTAAAAKNRSFVALWFVMRCCASCIFVLLYYERRSIRSRGNLAILCPNASDDCLAAASAGGPCVCLRADLADSGCTEVVAAPAEMVVPAAASRYAVWLVKKRSAWRKTRPRMAAALGLVLRNLLSKCIPVLG